MNLLKKRERERKVSIHSGRKDSSFLIKTLPPVTLNFSLCFLNLSVELKKNKNKRNGKKLTLVRNWTK